MQTLAGKAIHVEGIVQGVGFRPFVHNLATRLKLTGDVYNSSQGVFVRLFGKHSAIDGFLNELSTTPPPLASITNITVEDLPYESLGDFRIVRSDDAGRRTVTITPDAAICADCLRELNDPNDRRYHYPFINCTNCGPRYTIIEDVPYDRPNTTMRDFQMCSDCREEYDNPVSRRYHAQPNCCPICGPSLTLIGEDGDPIEKAVELLRSGKIVAIKGLGGFHLACDARNEYAVVRLRERKYREEKPFAVMVRTLELAETLIEMPRYAAGLFNGPVAPILVGRRKNNDILAPAVAPNNDYYGVMLPYTPLHMLLLQHDVDCLVMTSANRTDEPICIDNDEAVDRLSGIADAFLMHDRRINLRIDDSVLFATDEKPTIIRRARGYVPSGIETGIDVTGLAAFGALLKNTFSLGRDKAIYPSQHIGDLDNVTAMDMFHEVYDHLREILDVEVTAVACDLHPDYQTTRLAEETQLPLTRVQHHHAHLASLMAEKRVYGRSIGFALDGTGFGDDGQIWGGEAMIFDPASYQRVYHLEYVPLPGGDKAAREPWRMALTYLHHNDIDYRKYVNHAQAEQLAGLLDSKIPLLNTSSTGRLFDAVSSLCNLCHIATFEAKAPMLLEAAIGPIDDHYDFEIHDDRILTGGIIKGVVSDLDTGVDVSIISGRFHNTLVEIIANCARRIRQDTALNNVFLSGGVLMNNYISHHARRRLTEEGFTVYTHTLLPPNDGAISVGQLLVAAFRHRKDDQLG